MLGISWYLYLGHLWNYGWSIVDVTDVKNPKVVKFVPGPPNTWTIQMEMHDNIMLTALQVQPPIWGGDPNKPHDEGVLIWDISDPVNPKQLSQWKTGSTGIHRIGYPGGKYASLAANMPGFKGQILVFLDISDPKNPKEVEPVLAAGAERGRASVIRADLFSWSGDHRRRQGIFGLWTGGSDAGHQRHRASEADRAARFRAAVQAGNYGTRRRLHSGTVAFVRALGGQRRRRGESASDLHSADGPCGHGGY